MRMFGVLDTSTYTLFALGSSLIDHLHAKFDMSWRCRKGIPIDRDEGLQVLRLQLSLC